MKNYLVLLTVTSSVILDAENEDDAIQQVEDMDADELLEHIRASLQGDALSIDSVQ